MRDRNTEGIIIADSRTHESNIKVAHSIHTQKYRSGSNPYPSVAEVPIFAASDNHAGLQIADMLASTLLFPCAIAAHVEPRQGFVHDPRKYEHVRTKFGSRLNSLSYHEPGKFGLRGFEVKDNRNFLPHGSLFEPSQLLPTRSPDAS